eukprot:gi/632954844/ref/XP_007893177.1/ PREDICTED: uncharacterized protein LOC103179610 [Callorhinchus milii]
MRDPPTPPCPERESACVPISLPTVAVQHAAQLIAWLVGWMIGIALGVIMAGLISQLFFAKRPPYHDHCETTGCRTWPRVRTDTVPNDLTGLSAKAWCVPHSIQESSVSALLDNFLVRAFLVAFLIILMVLFFNFLKKRKKMWDKYAGYLKIGPSMDKNYLKKEKKRREIKRFRRGLAIQEKIMRKLQQMEMKIRDMEDMIMKFAKKMTRRVTESECTSRSSSCICSRCHTPSPFSTEMDSHPTTEREREDRIC